MKLSVRRLLKSVATKDAPLARGFGKVSTYFWLIGREEDARLIDALFALHQRQFQEHRQITFSEFDRRIRERRSSDMGIICKGTDFRNEERAIRNQVQQGLRRVRCPFRTPG